MYHNPYSGETFFGFFLQLIYRIAAFFQGKLSLNDVAADEVQILVLTGVAISSSLVGTFLVLRKMTMLANALSHTILVGIVISYYLLMKTTQTNGELNLNMEVMLLTALIMGLFTAFLTEFFTYHAKLQEDASIGLVFTSLFALGVILVTVLARNAHVGLEVVMGNVDALRLEDCNYVYLILGVNLLIFVLLFKEFKLTTFDSSLAKALGFSPIFFNYLLMTQVSATSIGAFRAVGVLMVLTFITGPPLTARLLTHSLKTMLLLSSLLGFTASLIGVALSRHLVTMYGMTLSTAGIVVCVILLQFLVAAGYKLCQTELSITHNGK